MNQPAEPSLARVAGWTASGLGTAGLIAYVAGFAFGAAIPTVVRYAHLGAAALELSLGFGITRGRRAAWAFTLSLEITMMIIALLALPQMLRSGSVGLASAGFGLARAMLAAILVVARRQFPSS